MIKKGGKPCALGKGGSVAVFKEGDGVLTQI